jgi:hypothetical protein
VIDRHKPLVRQQIDHALADADIVLDAEDGLCRIRHVVAPRGARLTKVRSSSERASRRFLAARRSRPHAARVEDLRAATTAAPYVAVAIRIRAARPIPMVKLVISRMFGGINGPEQ